MGSDRRDVGNTVQKVRGETGVLDALQTGYWWVRVRVSAADEDRAAEGTESVGKGKDGSTLLLRS